MMVVRKNVLEYIIALVVVKNKVRLKKCLRNFQIWESSIVQINLSITSLRLIPKFWPVFDNQCSVWETIFFKHSPKWPVDWNKYSPKWNRACHVWRVTFFLNSPTICNKYQINNTVMFNNLFCRFWQVINLVKKDQHSLKSCVDLFFLNFEFRCLRLLSFNARYKTCMSNPVPTHI